MSRLKFYTMKSPVGMLKLVATDKKLVAILWDNERLNRVKLEEMMEESNPVLSKAELQLNEYFDRKRKAFDLPIEADGTEFQKAVWRILAKIPYGSTWTYKQIAEMIDRPQASRAVGAAIGRNPISIIIPCHRVIGTNHKLTGFAGGLDRKRILLDLEN